MPFKIKKAVSSNKEEIHAKKEMSKVVQAQSALQGPQPFIDGLTVTVSVPEGHMGNSMYNAHIAAMDDVEHFVQVHTSKKYLRAYRIKLPHVVDFR